MQTETMQTEAMTRIENAARLQRNVERVDRELGPVTRNGGGHVSARFLGWFSVGLGLAEIAFPRKLARVIGAPERPMATRLRGLRELGVGMGILASQEPSRWIKARVAGDALDLALLKSAYGSDEANRFKLTAATAAVTAITAADIVCARETTRAAERTGPSRIRVESSMAINKPPEECYRVWSDFDNMPCFMRHLENVRKTGERTSHWKMKRFAMKSYEWDSEITRDEPGELIEWRSMGGDIENSGSIHFEPRISGRGTVVRLVMEYAPPTAGTGGLGAKLLKSLSEHSVREDLRRFKSFIECGEIPTTDGQSSGRAKEIQ
jgi:uncharacterized membrane protein